MAKKSENTRERILGAAESLVMTQGFAGTSIDDILKATGLTKGAFFHHFKGKGDLARELVEMKARQDLALFEGLAAKAEAQSGDPLEQIVFFLKSFEELISDLTDEPGCMYAVYTYESMQFDPSIRDFVADALRRWTSIYVRKFHEVLDRYEPAMPVTARQLAEMIVAVLQGGFVLARAYGDVRLTARQSEQFRNYLELLFGGRGGRADNKAPRQTAERRAAAKALRQVARAPPPCPLRDSAPADRPRQS